MWTVGLWFRQYLGPSASSETVVLVHHRGNSGEAHASLLLQGLVPEVAFAINLDLTLPHLQWALRTKWICSEN